MDNKFKKRIVTFPRMGKEYTLIFQKILEDLGFEVVAPFPNSEKTIKFGVKHSSDMMCFPYKVTLGNFKEALERGVNTLVMWDSRGRCRFRHYWRIQEQTLKDLGYKFEICPLNLNFFSSLKKINPSLNPFKILKVLAKYWKKIKEIDRKKQVLSKDKINIGLIGEIYTILEESVNSNIAEKLKKLGTNVYYTVTLSDFLKESLEGALKLKIRKRKWRKEAEKYLNGPLGGHGFENIINLLWLRDYNIDGVVHLLPMSCMPETTVEPIINKICQEAKIPLLRLAIDETNSEANVNTRVETFVELIKRKKQQNKLI